MPLTTVLDYGLSRPARLLDALKRAGIAATPTSNSHDVRAADRLILPDADDDDRVLERGMPPGILDAVVEHVARGRPLLAVGFGLSLLLEGSAHASMPGGLEVFRAPIARFDPRMADEHERPLKTPHVGFSFVVGLDRHPTVGAVVPPAASGAWFYFRHRLCAPARVPFADVAVAHHGVPFAGAIWRDQILALQFLPELSGPIGLHLLTLWDRSGA